MISNPTFQVTARFDAEGKISMRVTAVTPYGNRSVSVSEDVTDEKLLAKLDAVFASAIKSLGDQLTQKGYAEAARALTVAHDNDESLHGGPTIVRVNEKGEEYTVAMNEKEAD